MYLFFVFLCIMFVIVFFFFSSRRRHTRLQGDWSSDVCSSDLSSSSRPASTITTSRASWRAPRAPGRSRRVYRASITSPSTSGARSPRSRPPGAGSRSTGSRRSARRRARSPCAIPTATRSSSTSILESESGPGRDPVQSPSLAQIDPPQRQRRLDRLQEVGGVDGLRDAVERAEREGPLGQLGVRSPVHHSHLDLRGQGDDGGEHADPAEPG